MERAVDSARYLLWLGGMEPEPELVTHMRLQKLLYYLQGWSLAMRNQPFFEAEIQGWVHGPVVTDVWPVFTDYGDCAIPRHEAQECSRFSRADRDFAQSIWESYKQYSAAELRRKTHSERPWVESRMGLGPDERGNRTIRPETMRAYFRAEYEKRALPGMDLASQARAEADIRANRGVSVSDIRERVRDALRSQASPGRSEAI